MIVTKGMYDKEFKFDNNGKEESIIIKPLNASYMSKLFSIVQTLNSEDVLALKIVSSDNEEVKTDKQLKINKLIMSKILEDKTLQDVIDIVTATVEKSYPTMDKELREEFITNNMFWLSIKL